MQISSASHKCFLNFILYILCLFIKFECGALQRVNSGSRQSIEERKCSQYKVTAYESVQTFSHFMHGAPELQTVIDNCKSSNAPFIVNGVPAAAKEFPHAARLANVNTTLGQVRWFCGGTLISERFVLTAAHCFYSSIGVVNRVRLGELDFSSTTDNARPQDFNVLRTIEHPNYSYSYHYHDIGLVELDTVRTPLVFSQYILPACLPVSSGDDFNDLIAIGWGTVSFYGSESSHLLKVRLNQFTHDSCTRVAGTDMREKLPLGIVTEQQICAGSSAAKDTCHGDSGGPLLAYHQNYPCMYYLVGVTSAGLGGCGTPGVPAIYTRVFNYINWIKQFIWQN